MLGLANGPGSPDTPWIQSAGVPFDMRYQYLSGGVNTGAGWETWNTPTGEFATLYMNASAGLNAVPVFSYYEMLQSNGSAPSGSSESVKDLSNLSNTTLMSSYYGNWKLLMQECGTFGKPVVVHVEPDLWGYIEQQVTGASNTAVNVPASVASSGVAECSGLPNTAQGFALALLHMRDLYAPNAILGIHLSSWGNLANWASPTTGLNIQSLASQSAAFLETCGIVGNPNGISSWDLFFGERLDRDADYYKIVNGDPNEWYTDQDYGNLMHYFSLVNQTVKLRFIMWQLPCGNYYFLTCNDTANHYMDPTPQYFLENYPTNGAISSWAGSGCIGLLFGAGASGCTTYDDASGAASPDNPTPAVSPNLGNTSSYTDNDGGYLRLRCGSYYARGKLTLP
jgi:hypothetical protein